MQLTVGSECGRWAIYNEQFPGRWDELEEATGPLDFSQRQANQLLAVFANHWDRLHSTSETPDIRYHLTVLTHTKTPKTTAVAFFGRALQPDRLVVAYPLPVRTRNLE